MIKEKNAFFLVLMIIQKLITYIILAPRKLLLVMMLFFMKLNSGYRAMVTNLHIRILKRVKVVDEQPRHEI